MLSVPGDDTRNSSTPSTAVTPPASRTSTTIAHAGATTTTTSGAVQGAVRLRTVDFGGQREYLYTHPLFCTSRAVYALCAPLDELFGKPPADVVDELRNYASMVQVRAPDAQLVVVFTKADQVPGMSPDAVPTAATRWMHDVATALRAEFGQVVCGLGGDDACAGLVVSSKDGWETGLAHACVRLAQLALARSGAGDTLPASYGKMRDELHVAGAAWKKNTGKLAVPMAAPVDDGCFEETKGEEGSSTASATRDCGKPGVHLVMQWGEQVPIVTVAAVRNMAVKHCGLSRFSDIHQPLLLLHHMGCVVYGGAHAGSVPSQDGKSSSTDDGHVPASHPDMSQLVVLDPQWLANMLSRVVAQYDKHHDDTSTRVPRGQVTPRDVALAWHGFPDELLETLLKVLFALEVAFPGMGVSDTITVPALLPEVPSNADKAIILSARRNLAKLVCSVVAACRVAAPARSLV